MVVARNGACALVFCMVACSSDRQGPTAASGGATGAGSPDAGAVTLPLVPVGLDAYTMWDRLPSLRIGTRTYMRSTYDRSGGNEGADASHFIRQESATFFTALDVAGPGVLTFARANHWHGSPWHYVVDGTDVVVQESSTSNPNAPVSSSVFDPQEVFPSPLTWTWATTRGADLNWVPVPFEHTFELGYERTHYGTGYFIYQSFPVGADNLSHPVTKFDAKPPDPAVLALLSRAGEDIAPTGDGVHVEKGTVDVPAGSRMTLAARDGAGTVRALKLRIARGSASALSRARLVVTWDGRAAPSIDAPVGYFFGAATLFDRDDREWLVKGLLETVHFDAANVELATYFPMPYFRGAKVELIAETGTALTGLSYEVRTVPRDLPEPGVAYFHATYRDHGTPTAGKDLVLLDTKEVEGGGDYCGAFVGTSFSFSDRAELTGLEGDPRFFFDDSDSPQGYGTGTEEWAGGGDYWGGQNMTLPLAGHPVGATDTFAAKNDEDRVEGAYRWLIADAMPFGKNARIQLEHGGTDESTEHYRTVTYWYGLPGACLVQSDALDVGDTKDESAHAYTNRDGSAVETLTSRSEVGVAQVGSTVVVPETTEDGRHTTGVVEFAVALLPDNVGALLRRKLDYTFADQSAKVYVADDRDGAPFVPVGEWYLAGSNRAVYSNPPGELDPGAPVLQTSDRRFRDDEFLIPRGVTEGRVRVRVRLVTNGATPRPLVPGGGVQPRGWSELRYRVYSYVLPAVPQE